MYILFAGTVYYPGGGWNDYKGTFASKAEAEKFYQQGETINDRVYHWEWAHIVDANTKTVIACYFDGKER